MANGEIYPRRLGAGAQVDNNQRVAIVSAAAGLVGLISLFIAGIVLYCLLPTLGHLGLATLFVACICAIITMYGGGFATIPAYLADIFGTQMVGAIHGRLITSWSVASS